jgi:aminomethyltransferase
MPAKTHLYDFHVQKGHMTEFAGFHMPLWYEGIVSECKAVRNSVGLFDTSHMGRAVITGSDTTAFLNYVTTNDVASLEPGRGHYSVMCNEEGGIIDDIIVNKLADEEYLVVFNAGNRKKDLSWFRKNAERFNVKIRDVSDEVSMFAVQGPNAQSVLQQMCSDDLSSIPRFGGRSVELDGIKATVTRTGYTGEDGFEVFTWDSPVERPSRAVKMWEAILDHGRDFHIKPCGLGARDVLRLEAGMCLYGHDITESTTPLQAKLGFVVKLTKGEFIGRGALAKEKVEGPRSVRVGLRLLEAGIPRPGCDILKDSHVVGKVTSGTFSPTIGQGIAMGYVPREYSKIGEIMSISIRGKSLQATVTGFPFYDRSKYGWQRT